MESFTPDSVVYISGAGSGIGRASALQFVADGARKLAIVDIVSGGLQQSTALIKERSSHVDLLSIVADLSKEEEVHRVFAEIQQRFGRLDVAVNCAGITGTYLPIEQLSSADLDKVLNVNLRSLWLCEKAQIEQFMRQEERPVITGLGTKTRGSIVNIASMLGTITMPHASPYVMSKHGVVGLTKTDALDYANRGIRVNAICPGFIQTNLLDSTGWEALAPLCAATPMNRLGTAEEVAFVVTFLASDRASFMTGSVVLADGGYTVK